MKHLTIEKVIGREIIDSRGNPTVEAEVYLSDGDLYIMVLGLADRYDYPTIIISASVTSFNKKKIITLSAYSKAESY